MRRRNMDAFTKKHLKLWLQGSVFSGDRRKVGKIIRAYVRRHPEVLAESRSWPEIQRLAEASGINPREIGVLRKQREARERAALIRSASGRNPRRVFFDQSIQKYTATKFLSKYGNLVASGDTKAAAVRNLKDAIQRAKSGSHNSNPWHPAGNFTSYEEAMNRKRQLEQAGHTVNVVVSARGTRAENYSVYTRAPLSNPAELMVMAANPRVEVVHGENPPVEEIAEAFSGTEVEFLDVYNEPHMPRGRYAYLGELLSLHIKPAKGGQVQRISFSAGADAPIVVTDSTAKQIYFVNGNQDISEALAVFGAQSRIGDDLLELGIGRRIDYKARKEHVADPDEDKWKHDHGEENGIFPTVLFDTRNKKLLYEGGNYRIEGPWIRN